MVDFDSESVRDDAKQQMPFGKAGVGDGEWSASFNIDVEVHSDFALLLPPYPGSGTCGRSALFLCCRPRDPATVCAILHQRRHDGAVGVCLDVSVLAVFWLLPEVVRCRIYEP